MRLRAGSGRSVGPAPKRVGWVVLVLVPWLVAIGASPARATDDPDFARQWNLSEIGAPAAWASSTGAGVTIGIVDGGVDTSHPDLRGKIDAVATCLGGTCREGAAPDTDGHGSAVAGIAAATSSNATGIAGMAPDARLVVAKALDGDGVGRTGEINSAIQFVVDRGARVVNLSLGDSNRELINLIGTPLRTGIEYAWSRGAIPVLAAGNDSDHPGGAGSFNYGGLNAVVVGATDRGGGLSRYSSALGNAKWGVVAPGGASGSPGAGILTTDRSARYQWVAGTSMAAPHVSGILALLLAQGLQPKAAVERLLATLDRSAPCGDGCQGRVRADTAVARISGSAGPVAATSAPVLTDRVTPEAALGTPGDVPSPALTALAVTLLTAAGAGTAFARQAALSRSGSWDRRAGRRRTE